MALPSDPNVMYPRPKAAIGFPRWRFVGWLRLYVEDSLARLPSLLLVPVLGTVIGTSIAISDLATVKVGGKLVAAPPSISDVLWPAVSGGLLGILCVTAFLAVWGAVSYLLRGGDDTWGILVEPHPSGGSAELVYLVCKGDIPADPNQLGAMEVVIRRPVDTFESSDVFAPRPGRPYGVIATGLRALDQPGTYRIRWYATEHRGSRLHEVARMEHVVASHPGMV